MVLWSTQTKDITGASPQQIRSRILHGAHDGGIVLLHSGLPNTVEALPETIANLRSRGYQFVTVSTLLSKRN
jgi:peptidoglycan/xylan/chitin deacetylase (PgdA/CDA1 family)